MNESVSEAPSHHRLLRWVVVTDAIALVLGLGTALLVRMQLDEVGVAPGLDVPRHLAASLALGMVMLICYWAQGLYEEDQILAGTAEYGRITHGVIYAFLVALALSYFAGPLNYTNGNFTPIVSRSWLVLTLTLGTSFSLAGRFILRRVVWMLRRRGAMPVRIVIVGASAAGVDVARHFQAARNEGLRVVGFLDEYLPIGEDLLPGVAVIGRPADLALGRIRLAVDEYVLVPHALPHQRLEEITALMVSFKRPIVRMVVTPSAILTNGVLVAERAQVPVVTLRQARIVGADAALKRSFDVFGAALGLVILGVPAMVAIVRARLRGRRPLMRRTRIYGRLSHPTLRLLSSEVSPNVAIRGVPALVSVIFGDFSLVGPRPVPLDGAADAPIFAPGLSSVKPGLTGPWRLIGPNANPEEQITRDLAYVRDHTLWEDLRILTQSLRRLNRGRYDGSPLTRWEDVPLDSSAPADFARRDVTA